MPTSIIEIIKLLLQLLVKYLTLRVESYREDFVEKIDTKINTMNEKREKLRPKPDQQSQDEASKLMDAILDEKKKLKWFNERTKVDE